MRKLLPALTALFMLSQPASAEGVQNWPVKPRDIIALERVMFNMIVTGDYTDLYTHTRATAERQRRSDDTNICWLALSDLSRLLFSLDKPQARLLSDWPVDFKSYRENMRLCEEGAGVAPSARILPSDLVVTLLPEWRQQAIRDMLAADQAAAEKPVQ